MLEVFFHYRGLSHYEITPEEQTLDKKLNDEIRRRLRDSIRRKRPGNGQETIGIRYMDYPVHRPLLVSNHFRIMEFLSKMRY